MSRRDNATRWVLLALLGLAIAVPAALTGQEGRVEPRAREASPVPALLDRLQEASRAVAAEAEALAELEAVRAELDPADPVALQEYEVAAVERQEELELAIERAAAACAALGEARDPRALPSLCEAVSSPHASLARAASRAVLAIDGPGRLELLVAVFHDRPSRRVAKTIGALHEAVGVAPCLAALEGLYSPFAPDERRAAVIAGIAEVQHPTARELLRRLARSGDALAFWPLAVHLTSPDGEPELLLLIDALEDGDLWAQAAAASALARTGPWGRPRTIPRLVDALARGDERLARHAVAALRDLTGERLDQDWMAWAEWWEAHEDELDARAREEAP